MYTVESLIKDFPIRGQPHNRYCFKTMEKGATSTRNKARRFHSIWYIHILNEGICRLLRSIVGDSIKYITIITL